MIISIRLRLRVAACVRGGVCRFVRVIAPLFLVRAEPARPGDFTYATVRDGRVQPRSTVCLLRTADKNETYLLLYRTQTKSKLGTATDCLLLCTFYYRS